MRTLTLLVSISASGCQLVGDYTEFEYETGSQPTRHACEVLPPAKDDDHDISVMARVDLPDDACLWIDRTEVSVEQYRLWLDEVPPNAIEWEPTWCDWKRERENPIGNPDDACVAELLPLDLQPFADRKPIRCVDFCEAEAFCRWAGKRLCHDSDGPGIQGPRGYPQEWRLTCTNQMVTRYPWGNDSEDFCNTGQTADACVDVSGTCGPAAVGQKSDCSTPQGIVDLLGNVAEWVFSCNLVGANDPLAPAGCLTRGGGYDDPLLACEAETTVLSDSRKPALGFRCCADLTTDEETAVRATRR